MVGVEKVAELGERWFVFLVFKHFATAEYPICIGWTRWRLANKKAKKRNALALWGHWRLKEGRFDWHFVGFLAGRRMSWKLAMTPATGERRTAFVGDRLTFALRAEGGKASKCVARLRTTIGSGEVWNDEVVRAFEDSAPIGRAAWQDLPMEQTATGFRLSLVLAEPGFYRAKAYLTDEKGFQHWPAGEDFGVSVHPSDYRTANLVYCAWPRLFGKSKESTRLVDEKEEERLRELDRRGYAVIPPSGTLRDLKRALGHMVERLGCRIVHLLPVNPTPTTFARLGRYGSPYASLDWEAMDPALVEFDCRTTGEEQFCELTAEAHRLGARVFLDLGINHTGWGSRLHEARPQWFRRQADGCFASPGAWGTVWKDLVELEHSDPELGKELARIFLLWCRRGVDGFRCDAGYMVPWSLWQYVTARVRREFPSTIFLLEGLGGAWEVTERLLSEGGMQWAYSELFQNYSGEQISRYLDYSLRQSSRLGLYLHYSETHDNPRLAARGKDWSLLRNRLCGLASVGGGFGFTCGVEWLASEKIIVHQRTGLNWGSQENIVEELSRLNRLLAGHPCFFDGAVVERLSDPGSTVLALKRVSREGKDCVLVLVNTNVRQEAALSLSASDWESVGKPRLDLLGQDFPRVEERPDGSVNIELGAGAAYCLGSSPEPAGLPGTIYRRRQAIKAWTVEAIQAVRPEGLLGDFDMDGLAELASRQPLEFLAAVRSLRPGSGVSLWNSAVERGEFPKTFPAVVLWEPGERRVVQTPTNHWLVFRDRGPFEVRLRRPSKDPLRCVASTELSEGVHLACVDSDRQRPGRASVEFQSWSKPSEIARGEVLFLSADSAGCETRKLFSVEAENPLESPMVLLTNGRGGMARLAVDFGQVKSKYDCLLGANLHAEVPTDRHILAKRARFWVNADGMLSPLGKGNLASFSPGPPARWRYMVCAGKGRWVRLEVMAEMMERSNTTVIRCRRMKGRRLSFREVERVYGRGNAVRAKALTTALIDSIPVSITIRVDVEDRNFHGETRRNEDSERYFVRHIRALEAEAGFVFCPAESRHLKVCCDRGIFHPEPEWCVGLPHPVEASRGQAGQGDAYSPGWFEVPIAAGEAAHLIVSAEPKAIPLAEASPCFERRRRRTKNLLRRAEIRPNDWFGRQLVSAADAFVARRGKGATVIAGYPWFLDWGRDALICARGLLACGYEKEVVQMLQVFGRFEEDGTLPNSLHGEDASNRDTSDAPLWYGVVCADLVALRGLSFLETTVGDSLQNSTTAKKPKPRTIGETLRRIALGYLAGTPNGIRVDADSGLVWSPSHFTWMDTNHPPGTPREGYPIEIQALWILLLRLLHKIGAPFESESWETLAARALDSLEKFYWLEEAGYYADLIVAKPGIGAAESVLDAALRSNFLLAISAGLSRGERAQRAVQASLRHLAVPGAVRSLAPLPTNLPLPVRNAAGQLLNDPVRPYWGRYEGDEDTRRKPAYHNGTAWTWTLGILCEALLRAWEFSPQSQAAARAYLRASRGLMQTGCLGQIPEILDGDAPHTQRGCDAQAWGVTETIRVWKMLE